MSVVHKILHESSNLSKIHIKKYLQNIAGSLSQSYQIKHSDVQLEVTGDDIELNVEQANPIGLILNELVSNAYKYAFSDQPNGQITISLKKTDKTTAELVVEDNGKGMPDSFDWRNTESLGLQPVTTLVENQLEGLIQYESDRGSKFTILFEIKNAH
jgi:two-component sensor histidine kinase